MSFAAKAWVVWILLFNAGFLYFLTYYQSPIRAFIGIFPSSYVYYLVMITVIGLVNWAFAWRVMELGASRRSDRNETERRPG
jgi:hypothetical protein